MSKETERVQQARESLAAALDSEKAAKDAHAAAIRAVGDAHVELKAALIAADKDLPRITVHTSGRFGVADSPVEVVVVKRSEKSLAVRHIGAEGVTVFRPSKRTWGAGRWYEYPRPKESWAGIRWVEMPQGGES